MSIIFPKDKECRIKEDPIVWIKNFAMLHGLQGKKKYLWFPAAVLKLLILVCRTVYVIQCIHNPNRVAKLVTQYPMRFMAICKMFYSFVDKHRIDYFYQTVDEEFWDFHVAGPKIEADLKQRFFYINLIVRSYFCASFMSLTLFTMVPLVDMPEGVRTLPNIIWTPFDTNPSPLHEFLYVILLLTLSLTLLGNIFYDFVFIYGIQHLTVQFILLRGLLTSITSEIVESCSDVEKINSKYFQDTVMNRLKICVNHHCKLLKFGKNLELFSSKILVPELLMIYANFVIIGYIVSVDHSDILKTMILLILTTACLIQVALYAIQASDMEVESLSVIQALYQSEWYLFRAPLKRALVLIMLNTERELHIKAGGTVKIDKPVIISLIQNAFSAITLLTALIDTSDGDVNNKVTNEDNIQL